MAINSRSKGGRGERAAAKVLKSWTGKTFAKTPSSGGLNWKTSNVAGDVVCTKEGHYFPFCVEVKNYKGIDFSHLLNPKIKNIDILDFWAQASRDAEKVGKVPLLMMRYNGLPKDFFFIGISQDTYNSLNMFARANHLRKTLKFWDMDKNIKLVLIPSYDFFKLPYKETKITIKKLLKNGRSL